MHSIDQLPKHPNQFHQLQIVGEGQCHALTNRPNTDNKGKTQPCSLKGIQPKYMVNKTFSLKSKSLIPCMDDDINIGPTNEMKSVLHLTSRVEALEGKKSHDDFNRERATVNKVAIE
jgi:hypothetical protein